MTIKTDKVQRLKDLARIAGGLELSAYMECNRQRAVYFMRKMNKLTKLAIHVQNGGAA